MLLAPHRCESKINLVLRRTNVRKTAGDGGDAVGGAREEPPLICFQLQSPVKIKIGT
jgi:hypothetical protein